MKRFVLVIYLIGFGLFFLQTPINSQYSSQMTDIHLQNIESRLKNLSRIQQADATFQLYLTANHSTFLLLDTRDGRIWQLHWSIDNDSYVGTKPINSKSLATQTEENIGRFTLHPTTNLWNYILLDQDTGRTWQCQFSIDKPKQRFIEPLSTARHY